MKKTAGKESRDPPADARGARSEATRAKLVAIAERLFAERGIEGVSLNDINREAGQRNKNATHYHFGSKQGLLQAILDKHEPGISARQAAMVAALEAEGAVSLRNLARAMVRPLAAKLTDADGGRYYLRFMAQLVVAHTLAALRLRESALRVNRFDRMQTLLRALIPDLPETVAQQRGILVAVLMMQSLAELARMLDGGDADQPVADAELFVANLEDCLTAILAAPPGEETAALGQAAEKGRRRRR